MLDPLGSLLARGAVVQFSTIRDLDGRSLVEGQYILPWVLGGSHRQTRTVRRAYDHLTSVSQALGHVINELATEN